MPPFFPKRGVITNNQVESEVQRTASRGTYNSALAIYAAKEAARAHQLQVEADEAATAVERARPEPGKVMNVMAIRTLRELELAANRKREEAKLAERNARDIAARAAKAVDRRLKRESESPEVSAR